MVRMIISLSESDKKWLERTGRRERMSSAAVVRKALALLRAREPDAGFRGAITASAGRWKKKGRDSQSLVDAMRDDWERGR